MNSSTSLIFVIGILCTGIFGEALAFILEGTSTSYAQFKKWNAGLNGTLEFEFKTDQGSGLLLYTDDGGTYDFFEIKLVESALRLRYNLGGGAQIVTVGRDLGDGHWHKVQVTRNNENTTLTVDGIGSTSISRGKEFEFGKLIGNSDVYIGGMPSWYNSKLTLLALPSVIFEPRFSGIIRNLVYADGETISSRRQEMKSRDAKVRTIVVLRLLPLLLPVIIIQMNEKVCWRPSKIEVQEGFVTQCTFPCAYIIFEDVSDMQPTLEECAQKKREHGLTVHPMVIGVAASLVVASYGIIDDITYLVDTPLKAIDICSKAIHVLDALYSLESEKVWPLIQRAMNDITTSSQRNKK